jgi:Zn-dependent protease with chaperone function
MSKNEQPVLSGKKKIRIHFKDIHSREWEHPGDKAALRALKSVPGLDTLIKFFFGSISEKSLRLMALASAVRVNDKQFSKLHKLYLESCKTLDVKEIPELYVSQSPFLNAGAVGMDRPFILLNSSMLETLNDQELMAVLGHELGHILSGHVLYKTMLGVLVQYSTLLMNIPMTGVALMGVIAALSEWDRKSELSADRAGLLVSQDPEISVNLLMKMAGGGQIKKMDLGQFVKQAEEYNEMNTLSDTFHKMLNTWQQSHPFPVVRTKELLDWVQSGSYDSILRGFYHKGERSFAEDFKEAKESYSKDIRDTVKPVYDDLKVTTEKALSDAKDFIDRLKNGNR